MPRAKYIEDIAKFLLIIEKYFTSEHSKPFHFSRERRDYATMATVTFSHVNVKISRFCVKAHLAFNCVYIIKSNHYLRLPPKKAF